MLPSFYPFFQQESSSIIQVLWQLQMAPTVPRKTSSKVVTSKETIKAQDKVDIHGVQRSHCNNCSECPQFVSVSGHVLCAYCGCPPTKHEKVSSLKNPRMYWKVIKRWRVCSLGKGVQNFIIWSWLPYVFIDDFVIWSGNVLAVKWLIFVKHCICKYE